MTKEIEETEAESWNRFPKTKFRMRPEGLKQLLAGLAAGGFCRGGDARISLEDDGVYISLCANSGKQGDIQALGLEVFIPVDPADMPKEKPDESEDKEPVGDVKESVTATAEDIKMADDGNIGESTEHSDRLGASVLSGLDSDSQNPTDNSVVGNGLQPSI